MYVCNIKLDKFYVNYNIWKKEGLFCIIQYVILLTPLVSHSLCVLKGMFNRKNMKVSLWL